MVAGSLEPRPPSPVQGRGIPRAPPPSPVQGRVVVFPEFVDDGLDAEHEELVPQMETKLQVVLMG